MLKSIRIQKMLSFRDSYLELRPLNVLIGPNASGKSNLIEIIALLQAAPRGLVQFINRGGGIADWLWKGADATVSLDNDGEVEVVLDHPDEGGAPLRYVLKLGDSGHQLQVLQERLEYEAPGPGFSVPYWFFQVNNGLGQIKIVPDSIGEKQELTPHLSPDTLTPGHSVLHERKEPTLYPIVNFVGKQFDSARMYREWNMGRDSAVRKPQRTDEPSDLLDEGFANLALVLNNLKRGPGFREIEKLLGRFYSMYEEVNVGIDAGMAQLWIREKGLSYAVPATRLSDGTLRFLSLLAILCHPQPPPLICIEEPELGLHPDVVGLIAQLLKSASERTQLIVTTHSERLVDELSDEPESVVVCERGEDFGTEFRRLSGDELREWLEEYQLGELWAKGEIGGTRW